MPIFFCQPQKINQQISLSIFTLQHQKHCTAAIQKPIYIWIIWRIIILSLNNSNTMEDDYEMFKIVIIGSTGTGKTNIATRYIRNQFNEGQKATIGVQFLSKIVQVRNQNIKVTLWDTAGQERYKSLSKVYYKGASGVLIVYDVTDPQSYLDVQSWMRLAYQNLNLNEVVMMIVGNKIDMENERKVPTERPLKEYKDKFDIDSWQVSAKTGYNVREIFAQLLQKIYEKTVEIKEDAFHDVSEYGASVVDQASLVAQKKPNPVKQAFIQDVIIEERKAEKTASKTTANTTKTVQNKASTVNKSIAENKDNKMTLKTSVQKKRVEDEKKKKGGCC